MMLRPSTKVCDRLNSTIVQHASGDEDVFTVSVETKLGVVLGSVSCVNSADSAVRFVEVEVQKWRATTIAVYVSWVPHGDRSLNAWTNDFRALPVCCNILHPWEEIITGS